MARLLVDEEHHLLARGRAVDAAGALVDGLVEQHLQRLDKGRPQLPAPSRTVKATLDAILAYQGVKVIGTSAIEAVAADIVRHCRSTSHGRA